MAKLPPTQWANEGTEKLVKVVLYPEGSIYNLTCLLELGSFSNKNRESTITSALQHQLIILFSPLEAHLSSFSCSPRALSSHWDRVISLVEEEHASKEAGAN